MCEFISWIEYENEIYFLTTKELNTKEGRELKKYLGSEYKDDIKGHGAIDRYWGLKGKGVHRECTDFTTPDNFPACIVKDIKRGAFEGIGIAQEILTQAALAEYEKIEQAAWVKYEKIMQPAWVEYEKIVQPAWVEYEKIEQAALAEYEKIEQAALAGYKKIKQAALAEYKKIEQAASAGYEKIIQAAFWQLVRDKKNRARNWK